MRAVSNSEAHSHGTATNSIYTAFIKKCADTKIAVHKPFLF
jgi:hypothetical protein